MGIIACKFGGTSTANANCFKRIEEIIRANPDRRYVVLSAPGRDGDEEKVTDMLFRAWRDKSFGAVVRRFDALARDLGVQMDSEDILRRAAALSEAALVSRGEYLCARLFSAWSGIPFVDAAGIIRFDARGALDASGTRGALRAMAARLPRAVIPGFYGGAPDGRVVTFPRNGSDITGALVAAGVGAALYENWTDVPGLMTGDPAVDPHAEVIPEISYAAMRDMTRSGARVLHPDCLTPVEAAGIPTRLRCTMDPDSPGTLIR